MSWPESTVGERSGPLSDMRVLDLTRILAGPFACQILADLGADVIKVERPGSGDETRQWGPPFAPSGDAAYFYSANRGRRSVELDFRMHADRGSCCPSSRTPTSSSRTFYRGPLRSSALATGSCSARIPAWFTGSFRDTAVTRAGRSGQHLIS